MAFRRLPDGTVLDTTTGRTVTAERAPSPTPPLPAAAHTILPNMPSAGMEGLLGITLSEGQKKAVAVAAILGLCAGTVWIQNKFFKS